MAFGYELQQERERLAISLETIAAATKVPYRHLLSLELEQFDQLPPGIFGKGVVRSYCRHLGLDEEAWLLRFPSTLQQEAASEWAEFAENVSRSRLPAQPRMGVRWWGVLLMIMALAALCGAAWLYVVQPQLVGSGTAAAMAQH